MNYEKKQSIFKRIFQSSLFKISIIFYIVFFVIATLFFSTKYYQKVIDEMNTYSAPKKLLSSKWIKFLSFFDLLGLSSIPKETVAVIKLSGIIHSSSGSYGININNVTNAINSLSSLYNLKAIIVSIDSPGGSGVESDLVSYMLRAAATKYQVPIYSFIHDIGASGGYWIACAGDKIFANQNSIVGSIGVRSDGFGFQNLINFLGIERRVYTSGRNKSSLDPFLPTEQDDIIFRKDLLKNVHNNFIQHVKTRRGDRLNADDEILFSGAVWTGNVAVHLGLIDGIINIDSFLRAEFPASSVKYITGIRSKLGFSSFFDEIFSNFFNKLELRLMSNFYFGTKLF
ncbi:MAG: S49 family peptidase [Rickettsia sp.]|nr:S49 family peptidase [Rickettsia sp.]